MAGRKRQCRHASRSAPITPQGIECGLGVYYLNLGRDIPWMFGLFVLLVIVLNYALTRTRWGRSMFAVGGNREAARRSGINVRRIYTSAFVLCSTLAAVGGILSASRLATSSQQPGTGDVNLNAIAAAVIGGTSLFGGRRSAYSALLGIAVIQAISNGLTLLTLSSSFRYAITGGVLAVAVICEGRMADHFIGIDVGTGSVRAGVFDASGHMLASAKQDIRIWRDDGDVVEQSSDDIWSAVCKTVRQAIADAEIAPASVVGLGFDATCSLVVLGPGGKPLPAGPSGDPQRNIIMWMDHRSLEQAQRINATHEDVLHYVGGAISPEMETPKLLWLAENLPDTFRAAWRFFDLTDFLTWRCTGSEARSVCTVTCKWTYLAHEQRWDDAYFRKIGLGMLVDERFERIGVDIVHGGTPLGRGLTPDAAVELGLRPGTSVAAGLIDAHAGGIGTVGARGGPGTVLTRMAYVFGTSACSMTTTLKPAFVEGVWGPYYSAMVPGLWLNEGGQSAAGAAIDHLVRMHPAADEADRRSKAQGMAVGAWLAQRAADAGGAAAIDRLVGTLHVVPEFLGNRAPFGDPNAKALIAGIGMDTGVDGLVGLYLAGLCGLGYGARQIIEAQALAGIRTDTIVVSGGAGQSPLVRQILADSTGLTVAASTSPEPVLLGSAMLAAVAAGRYESVAEAMTEMSELGAIYEPNPDRRQWHEDRFDAFRLLQSAGRKIGA